MKIQKAEKVSPNGLVFELTVIVLHKFYLFSLLKMAFLSLPTCILIYATVQDNMAGLHFYKIHVENHRF